jgi:predicted transcriptional regulator
MTLRAQVVRFLVEEEHITLTEVARMMAITRQTATRLYRSAPPLRAPTPPDGPRLP